MINNQSYNKYILALYLGGYHFPQMCQLYDFETKKWMKCANLLHRGYRIGKCYDKENKVVYAVGGSLNGKRAEYYDLLKNQWYDLPEMNCKHANYPFVWKNEDLLYVASCKKQESEFIDLREHSKFWKNFNTESFKHAGYNLGTQGRYHQLSDCRYLL